MDVTPPQNPNNSPQPPQPTTGPDPNAQQWAQPQQPQPAQQPAEPQHQFGQSSPAQTQSTDGVTPPAAPIYPAPATGYPQPVGQPAVAEGENPTKSFVVTFLLSIFLGSLGIDRFYLGHIGLGIAKLLLTLVTGFGGTIFTIIDWFLIAHGKLVASDDPRMLEGYSANKGWAKIVALVLVILSVLVFVAFVIFFVAVFASSSSTNY